MPTFAVLMNGGLLQAAGGQLDTGQPLKGFYRTTLGAQTNYESDISAGTVYRTSLSAGAQYETTIEEH